MLQLSWLLASDYVAAVGFANRSSQDVGLATKQWICLPPGCCPMCFGECLNPSVRYYSRPERRNLQNGICFVISLAGPNVCVSQAAPWPAESCSASLTDRQTPKTIPVSGDSMPTLFSAVLHMLPCGVHPQSKPKLEIASLWYHLTPLRLTKSALTRCTCHPDNCLSLGSISGTVRVT